MAAVPDSQLVVYLFQKRDIFSLLHTATGSHTVECILPLRQVVSPYPFREELVIVRSTTNDAAPLTVLQIALVRDCLLEDGTTLHEACNRPQWTVRLADRFAGYFSPKKLNMLHPTWKLNATGSDGQMTISSLKQYFSTRRKTSFQLPPVPFHPWQTEQALPHTMVIDTFHHNPTQLPSPEGWNVMKRNGRVWIADGYRHVTRMDAAQYCMLTGLHSQAGQSSPSLQPLQLISTSSRARQQSDLEHHVHWSRHLLAYIRKVTGAQLLVGASAMTYNQHFQFFVSPNTVDQQLGSSVTWPSVPALLLLDSFTPSARSTLLHQAAAHAPGVWILRKTMPRATDADLSVLLHLRPVDRWVAVAEHHSFHCLATPAPWTAWPVPAESFVSHVPDAQLQAAIPQSRRRRRASPPRRLLALPTHAAAPPAKTHASTRPWNRWPSRYTLAPLRACTACARQYPR